MAAGNELLDTIQDFRTLVKKDITAYNKWAPSYDSHLDALNYRAPGSVVEKWQAYHTDLPVATKESAKKHKLFDAGCGTGLVGEILAKSAAKDYIEIYGGDLSSEMLELAKAKAVYTDLQVVNLKEELPYEADSFDSVVCAGVFGRGHCGPECIPNLIRVLKPGCYFIATVNKELYNADWRKQIEKCHCELVEEVDMPYHDSASAIVIVTRKLMAPR